MFNPSNFLGSLHHEGPLFLSPWTTWTVWTAAGAAFLDDLDWLDGQDCR